MRKLLGLIKAPLVAIRRYIRWRRKSKRLDETDPFIYD